MPALTNTLKEQLRLYLIGQLSLEQFRDWFAPILRDAHAAVDPTGELLAQDIEWAFLDLERGASWEQVRITLTRLAELGK